MRVGLGEEQSARRAILNLNDELEIMSKEDIEALGQSIFSVLKAKSAKETDSPILKGKVFSTRKSTKGLYEDLVCDSGCTKTIVSKQICQDLTIQISPLSSSMIITDASGNSLNIIGTAKFYISNTQVLGDKRKLIEAAVLEGNTNYREILISLKLLKTWGLIHATFPQESVYSYMNRMNKSKNSAYSVLYSNQIDGKKGT